MLRVSRRSKYRQRLPMKELHRDQCSNYHSTTKLIRGKRYLKADTMGEMRVFDEVHDFNEEIQTAE